MGTEQNGHGMGTEQNGHGMGTEQGGYGKSNIAKTANDVE